jgi:hypothetical protein
MWQKGKSTQINVNAKKQFLNVLSCLTGDTKDQMNPNLSAWFKTY